MKKELLKPKIDVVFHSLFKEKNKGIIEALLSDILKTKTTIIETQKDRYLNLKYPEEKLGILDLRIELENGVKCNIEIQLFNKYNTIKRLLYYWSKLYSEELKRGDDYKELKKTISIMIVDYELEELKEIKDIGTKWQIRDGDEGRKILTEELEIYIIEIPKAKRIIGNEKKNRIAQWMLFLDNPNSKEVFEIMKENQYIKEAMEELEEISYDEELRRVAELKEKAILDERNLINGALEEGYQEGVEKGIKQGIEQGKKQGVKQGMKEGDKQARLKIAKKMLDNGKSIKEIIEITELTEEEINQIIERK